LANHGRAMFVKTDVTSETASDHLIATTITTYGKLDILVNNAGIVAARSVTSGHWRDGRNLWQSMPPAYSWAPPARRSRWRRLAAAPWSISSRRRHAAAPPGRGDGCRLWRVVPDIRRGIFHHRHRTGNRRRLYRPVGNGRFRLAQEFVLRQTTGTGAMTHHYIKLGIEGARPRWHTRSNLLVSRQVLANTCRG